MSTETKQPANAGAIGESDAKQEYQSGAGCLLMTAGAIVCAVAIVVIIVIFGDFAKG